MAGGKCVGSPRNPCPLPRISGRFSDLEVKCGDRVGLLADAENISDGTATTFKIRHYTKGQTVATENARLKELKVRDKTWVSKKVFQGWDPEHLDFKISANGASADSINRLRIYQYPDLASDPKTIPRAVNKPDGTNFGWTGKYDVEFKDRILIITVKIKLINRLGRQPPSGQALPTIGPPVQNKTKLYMKRNIEGRLSDKWALHRDRCLRGKSCNCRKKTECCKFKIKIQVEFVENGQHHDVNLFQGSNRVVSSNSWGRIPWDDMDYAHETGHFLGWYDEYTKGATGPAPWRNNRPGAVMGGGRQVPQLYYEDFRSWYQAKTGEPWQLVR